MYDKPLCLLLVDFINSKLRLRVLSLIVYLCCIQRTIWPAQTRTSIIEKRKTIYKYMQNYLSKTANDFTKHYQPSFLFFKSQIGLFIQGVFLTSPWLTWTIRRGYRSIALMRCQKKSKFQMVTMQRCKWRLFWADNFWSHVLADNIIFIINYSIKIKWFNLGLFWLVLNLLT